MRIFTLLAVALVGLGLVAGRTLAQGQYPIIDRVAAGVVQKYESSSCEQLAAQRAQRRAGGGGEMRERVVRVLRQNPQMREEFLNRVAAPIANKMFECGLIP
jgi:hypothetical protein